jgi:hypothetical protein
MEPIMLSGGSATATASTRAVRHSEERATASSRFLSIIDEDDNLSQHDTAVDMESGGVNAEDRRKNRLLNEGYEGDNDTEYDDDEIRGSYATNEDRAKPRLGGKLGAIGQRVARAIGDKKRKQSGSSYEMIPQVRVTSATSILTSQPPVNHP